MEGVTAAQVPNGAPAATEAVVEATKSPAKPIPIATAEEGINRLEGLLKRSEQFATVVSKPVQERETTGGRNARTRKTEGEEDKEMMESQERGKTTVRLMKQPPSVTGEMRRYQLEGLNWLINLHDNNINGILADEMGLGKTLQSLSLLAYLKYARDSEGPHLVIVPKSTSTNWLKECKRWTPELSVVVFHGDKAARVAQKKVLGQANVTITTYEICNKELCALKKINWEYIMIDEAHRIKNADALLSKSVRALPSKHRLLITGTPLQNNLKELWALLNFLLPTVFDSHSDFEDWFDISKMGAGGDSTIAARLHKILRPFLLRRLKVDVEKSLPPKVEIKLFVGLSMMQKQWYKRILSKDFFHINSVSNTSKTALQNTIMQLRKVCNHPYLFQGAEEGPPFFEGEHLIENSGKMCLLDKLLKKLQTNGSRVLIFSQMTRLLDILEDYMRWRGFQYRRIDGSTSQELRDQGMVDFNAPNSPIFCFLLSTRAGGLGINLQTADTVVLYDSDWNPQMDLQAQDRAHRIGQTKRVHVYRFVTESSVEEKIIERAMRKLYLDAVVIKQQGIQEKNKSLSPDELRQIVTFGANLIFKGENGTISDEDIDAIIARGATKTNEENEKLKVNSTNNLANFSLAGDSQTSYIPKPTDAPLAVNLASLIEPTARNARKANYNVNDYYNKITGHVKTEKVAKLKQRLDFQFFDKKRLDELERKEWESTQKLKRIKDNYKAQKLALERERKALEKKEKKEKARLERLREQEEKEREEVVAAGKGGVKEEAKDKEGSEESVKMEDEEGVKKEDDDKDTVKEEKKEVKEEVKEVPVKVERRSSGRKKEEQVVKKGKNAKKEELTEEERKLREMEEQAGCLTEKEKKEKAKLEAEGFGAWQKKHFMDFIKACETHGRKAKDLIIHNVGDKTAAEVKRYADVFWKRYTEIKDHKKYIRRIELGEQRIKKRVNSQRVVEYKVGKCKNPWVLLKVPYATNRQTYSAEEDRWMLCMLAQLGYGNWDQLKREVRLAWQFRFDWYLKSRTSKELEKRCDNLIKILTEEAKQEEASAKKSSKKRPSSSSTKKSAKKRRGR